MSSDQPYTPDDEDIFIAYRFKSLGLMRDPNDKPHDPEAMAEADAEYRRWLAAHDARVRQDAEARIKAVQDVLDRHEEGQSTDPVVRDMYPRMVNTALIRRALKVGG